MERRVAAVAALVLTVAVGGILLAFAGVSFGGGNGDGSATQAITTADVSDAAPISTGSTRTDVADTSLFASATPACPEEYEEDGDDGAGLEDGPCASPEAAPGRFEREHLQPERHEEKEHEHGRESEEADD